MKITELNNLYVATNDNEFKVLVVAQEENEAVDIAKKYYADNALSFDVIRVEPFEDINTVFDCDYAISGADEAQAEIEKPVITIEYLSENGRREEGYTITGDIGYGLLLLTVQDCKHAAYSEEDIVSAEEDDDVEYLKELVPEAMLNKVKEKGKTFAAISTGGYYNFFESLLEIMDLRFKKTAPAECHITECW